MDRNFRFDGATILLFGGARFDLHNEYDLVELGTDLAGTEVVLGFARNEYAFPETPTRVRVVCRGGLRFAFNNLLAAEPRGGFEMAYFNDGLPWEFIVMEDQAVEVDGLHIDLGDRTILRIACDTAEFQVVETRNLVAGPWPS